jgi:hypothetical protein
VSRWWTRAAAPALTAALLLCGCGVPQDDAPRALLPEEVPFASPSASPVGDPFGEGRVALYFVRDGAAVLSTRPVQETTSTAELLELLFAGPVPDEFDAGLLSFLPSTLTVDDLELSGSTAIITLGGPDSEVLRLQPLAYAQVVATLTPHRVDGVRFRLDGKDLRVPRADGSLTAEPVSREDYASLLAVPGTVPSTPSA